MKISVLALVLVALPAFATNPVATYDPAVVELTGTLDLQTFPGPPGYESIKQGDDIERHYYLKLDAPVDVIPNGKHSNVSEAEEERNVQVVQLALDEEDNALWAKIRKAGKGAHVMVRGGLFHRFTGHHHSRVLLEVQTIAAISG